ncbi:hypothetical protein HYH02_003034 [Chlamydomonas schloesseri]|uniref:Uncharacterized protein n=1 Tax=Chlamydomonas schloesseri TaxID=2026947 RepID=A0A835WUM7_9CHLO|nr:hypothetical protein HYH02_003034 [Chlamydomonas schloesseri]|eukprot:KAG2452805.1 hypothetical protein HYH02_003034 [Chlamydomonas schloesseri]
MATTAAASQTADALIEELKRDADKGELLLWASARGLSADVEELFRNGADPLTKDKHGRSAGHYAASGGHAEVLEALAVRGVDLDAEDPLGRGPLHYAAAGGHAACVSLLLSKGCWRDAPDGVDDTPLHLAARSGSVAAVKALVEAGAAISVRNKRSLTPFAEAVLAGRIPVAEWLGARGEGGLEGALAATYREMPLLHLAAGLGQAAAVEWLVRRQPAAGGDAPSGPPATASTATDTQLTPLHAAALSGDEATVVALLELGADPLSQTSDGKLPLELVPKVAPRRQPPPPPPPGSLPPPPDPAADAKAAPEPGLVRSARRAFKALARAAAEQGGVEVQQGVVARRVWGDALAEADKAEAAAAAAEEAAEEAEHPAAAFLKAFSAMGHPQQVARVEALARQDERALAELPYLRGGGGAAQEALAALAALRQAMSVTELFAAVSGLRADDEFQTDIRDERVRTALEEVKRTNNLERYEDQPAVMSVAAKFKRLHGVTRKTGLKVVIDDLRADLSGNDPASTAARAEELRVTQAACAANAAKAVLAAASAAVPEHLRSRAASRAASRAPSRAGGSAPPSTLGAGRKKGAAAGEGPAKKAGAAAAGGGGSGAAGGAKAAPERIPEEGEEAQSTGAAAAGGTAAVPAVVEVGDGPQQSAALSPEALEEELRRRAEEERAFQERLSNKMRVDKLRAAATSAWVTAHSQEEDDIGYVDKFAARFEVEASKAEGTYRKTLADYVGEETAQSLRQTGVALLFALLGFGLMWLLGLMPHQQTASLLARQAVVEAARRAQEAAAALAGLEGLEGPAEADGGARAAAAAAAMMGADAEYREGTGAGAGTCPGPV